jgi:hypothetical protein
MKKYTCLYVNIDSSDLWESLPEHSAMVVFADFITAIFKLYPGSEKDHKWSITNMDKLVAEHLHLGIHHTTELGIYYCAFL